MWYRRRWMLAVAVCSALAMASCSASEHKKAAEKAVEAFHAHLDAERYADIYREAHPDFRKSASEAEIAQFLAAVHRKLGKVQSSMQEGWRVNVTPGGTQVLLTYKTQFSSGPATENFTWIVEDGIPTLLGYNIDSRMLIVN